MDGGAVRGGQRARFGVARSSVRAVTGVLLFRAAVLPAFSGAARNRDGAGSAGVLHHSASVADPARVSGNAAIPAARMEHAARAGAARKRDVPASADAVPGWPGD